jgi:hypothetical protein
MSVPSITSKPQTEQRANAKPRQRSWFVAAINNPEFLAIVAFCLIGSVLTLYLALRFPDFAAVIAQYAAF